ncbi:MAG: polyprenyl synthetase family protein [Aquificota bacterium]
MALSSNPFKENPLIKQYLELIEKSLNRYMDSTVKTILEVGSYIFDGGGKRLRPLLVLLTSKGGGACEAEIENRITPLAVGLEYIHTASLLHDDVVDEATQRRGKPAAHTVFGNSVAVLTGDYMYANALYLYSTYGNQKMIEVVSEAVKDMAEGQLLELKSVGSLIDEETYFRIIDGKTGVLFAAATAVGALASKNFKEHYQDFWRLGLAIGRAFQLIDDALDYDGDQKKLGKPVGQDLKEGKTTYPLLAVLEHLDPKEVERILLKGSEEEINKLRREVQRLGGVEKTKERARKELNVALEILEKYPFEDIQIKNLLKEIINFVVERNL